MHLTSQIDSFDELLTTDTRLNPNIKRLDKNCDEPYIELKNMTIETPSMFQLFKNVNIKFNFLVHTVVLGPNGFGKSSIFRVIAGLWDFNVGTMTVPMIEDIF